MFFVSYYDSPVGKIVIVSDGKSLTGLYFEGQKYFPETLEKASFKNDEIPLFNEVKNWLNKYFEGKNPSVSGLPLDVNKLGGSDFRKEVWKILLNIPYGKTLSYGEIAKEIATKRGKKKMSAQAAGGAIGHNPVSIIIPCHRVVSKTGALTGYAGGVKIKQYLLELEGGKIRF